MIVKTVLTEKQPKTEETLTHDVHVTELMNDAGIQLRVCFEFSDDVQIFLKDGRPMVRFYNDNGQEIEAVVGVAEQELPF